MGDKKKPPENDIRRRRFASATRSKRHSDDVTSVNVLLLSYHIIYIIPRVHPYDDISRKLVRIGGVRQRASARTRVRYERNPFVKTRITFCRFADRGGIVRYDKIVNTRVLDDRQHSFVRHTRR